MGLAHSASTSQASVGGPGWDKDGDGPQDSRWAIANATVHAVPPELGCASFGVHPHAGPLCAPQAEALPLARPDAHAPPMAHKKNCANQRAVASLGQGRIRNAALSLSQVGRHHGRHGRPLLPKIASIQPYNRDPWPRPRLSFLSTLC